MYLTALSYAVAGVLFGLILLVAGRGLAKRLETGPAQRPFESGALPQVHAWSRFHPRYLNFALVFLLFQLLLPFLFPWAVVFRQSGGKALALMGVFIAILLVGLFYAWRERAFEWE